jgi:hypothetical protein
MDGRNIHIQGYGSSVVKYLAGMGLVRALCWLGEILPRMGFLDNGS